MKNFFKRTTHEETRLQNFLYDTMKEKKEKNEVTKKSIEKNIRK